MIRVLLTGCLFCCAIFAGCLGTQESDSPAAQVSMPPPESRMGEAGTGYLYALLLAYYDLKDALADDRAQRADQYAATLAAYADSLQRITESGNRQVISWDALDSLRQESLMLLSVKDERCEVKRIYFEKISDHLYLLLQQAEMKNTLVYRQYCPMAFNDKGAYWLSRETEIRNPYFGKKMLECGEVTDSLK
jgi:hypothetical protein